MQENEIMKIIEEILYISGDPVKISNLTEILGITELETSITVDKMIKSFEDERGLLVKRVNDTIQFSTRPEHACYIKKMLHPIQRQGLSQATIETLAIIAYKQPVTRNEIENIRGVKCDHSIANLIEKGLIDEKGRKDSPGKPIIYGTTDMFLRYFSLSDLNDLPKLKDENNT